MTNSNRIIDTMPRPTDPETVEDAFRCIDLVLSNQQSDWQGLTDALLEQSETSIIDTISISCFDDGYDDDRPPSEEVKACFAAMGTALGTSYGMSTLQIKTYQEMPLVLLQCILKNCGRLETLSIESQVTFCTTDDLSQGESKMSAADGATIIENLQIDFSEHLVNLPNLLSDHGITFESLEVRMEYGSSDKGAQLGTQASLRAKGGKHFPAELLCSMHRANSESSLLQDKSEDEMEDESSRMEFPPVLSHPANIISPLSVVLKNEQATSNTTTTAPPLTSLSLKLASVPSEEALLDVAKVLSKNTTLTSFHLKWYPSRQSRARGRRASVNSPEVSYRDSVLQAFENMLEKNFFLEDLQIGMWNLTPKTKYYLSLNRGKKRRFMANSQFVDISQQDWMDAIANSSKRKLNDMSLDINPYASSTRGGDLQEDLRLSSVYYFVRGNPPFVR